MHWELWDAKSNSLVEVLDTEDEGLQAVHEMVAINSPDLIDDLGLMAMYDEGESHNAELPLARYGEALKERLVEWVQRTNADASREVHQKIRRWLAEEGWQSREVHDPQSSFNVMAKLQDGQEINIYQLKEHNDHITFHIHLVIADPFQSWFIQLPELARRRLHTNMLRDSSLLDVDFIGFADPVNEMRYRSPVYFDGLIKDVFVRRAKRVLSACAISVQIISEAIEEIGISIDQATDAEVADSSIHPVEASNAEAPQPFTGSLSDESSYTDSSEPESVAKIIQFPSRPDKNASSGDSLTVAS